MTVPGGVPNLPAAALTLETLAQKLQDQTAGTMRDLANLRIPSIFDLSNGGSILSDLTPFGIITRIWAEVNSAIANADPADIQGPEDIPPLLLDFIEGLPVIGELVGLLEAIGGTYDGADPVLIAVQEIFYPIRKLLQLVSGQPVGWPTLEEVTVGWTDLAGALAASTLNLANFLAATGQASFATLGALLADLITWLTAIPANLLAGALSPTGVTLSGTPLGTLTQYLSSSGQFAAAQLTGGINTAVTIGGQAVSSLFNGSGQYIGVLNAAATGALNSALTFAGNPLSTVLGNITASTGALNAAGLTGGINTAVTIGGQAVSTLFNGSGQFIGVLNSAATGALNTGITVGGVTLNTLFTNINSSGQLLLSGATGALNTAVTIGGQAVSTIFNGSGQFIGVLNSAATGALNTAVTLGGTALSTLSSTWNTAGTNAAGLVQGINNAAAGLISGGSTAVADAATNVALLFGSAPAYLQGLGGVFGQTATNAAYAAAAAAAAAQAAQIAAQQSAFNAVFNVSPATAGNVNITVDFSLLANQTGMSGIMLPASGSGSGFMGVTSGEAKWQGGASTDREVFPTVTTSDYQVITVTLGGLYDLVSAGANVAYASIFARSDSARTTAIRISVRYDGSAVNVYLWSLVSGVGTILATSAALSLSAGSSLKVIIGDPSSLSPYAMQVLHNTTPILTYTDAAHVSQLGASYRYVGLEMSSTTSGKYPPAVRTVTYQDNPPPPASYPYSGLPTAGTKGRRYSSGDCGREDRDNGTVWENVWIGPLSKATAPPSSGWSWVNQGAASIAADADALLLTAPSSTRNWRMRVRTLTPSSNYIAAAYIEVAGALPTSTNRWYTGIILRNSSSGSFISFGPSLYASGSLGAQLTIYRWTNATTFSASSFEVPASAIHGGSLINMLRIRDDGTNRYFEYSLNGVDWQPPVLTEGRTTFITPDQFGFGVDNEASGADCKIRLRSLAGIS